MKAPCFVFVVLIAVHAPLAADGIGVIERLQSAEQVAYRDGGYAVLAAAGILPPEAPLEAALEPKSRKALGWSERPAEDALTVAEFSYLVMQGFDIPGGLMYRLFPGPRYAVRELRFRRILTERVDAGEPIRGVQALRVIGNAAEWAEGQI
jgi:hypothetical protein